VNQFFCSLYASAVPGTIKHALEKQKEKVEKKASKGKVDKTSVGSRGSKKSKCIWGISPNADIPEDAKEEQEEAKEEQEETTNKALEIILCDD